MAGWAGGADNQITYAQVKSASFYARAYTITANATAINVTPIHTTDATSERMVRRDMAKSPFSR